MNLNITIPENREAGLKFVAWQHNQTTGETKTPEQYLESVVTSALDSYEASRSAHVKADGLAKFDAASPEQQAALKASLAVSEPWLQ